MALTKKDFVNAMQEASGCKELTKAGAEKAYEAFFDLLEGEIKKGEAVTFRGFGSFSVKQYNARTGRNPQTGETITIPAQKRVKFQPAPGLNESVN